MFSYLPDAHLYLPVATTTPPVLTEFQLDLKTVSAGSSDAKPHTPNIVSSISSASTLAATYRRKYGNNFFP